MGNQQCCVSSQTRDFLNIEHFCTSPPSSGAVRNFKQASHTENPHYSHTPSDQLTDSNSAFYKPAHTDYPIRTVVTAEEEARALSSKKKQKLRRKKPPPLDNVDSPREYTDSSNTFYLTTNFDKAGENYTEPSYKITTTQEEVGYETQEAFSKKLGTEYWENGEEDKNLSVRLSDKRLLEKRNGTQNLSAYSMVKNETNAVKPSKGMETGMVAKIGQDLDDEVDPDEERFDQSSQRVFKITNEPQAPEKSDLKASIVNANEISQASFEDKSNHKVVPLSTGNFGGNLVSFMEKPEPYTSDRNNMIGSIPRPGLIHEDADSSLVHVNPYSYNSNSKRERGSQGEKATTEETIRRYADYKNTLRDNASTTGRQHAVDRAPHVIQRDPKPFNLSDGGELESKMHIPEKLYEVIVTQYSNTSSPQKHQEYVPRYEDSIYSSEKVDDHGTKRVRVHDENGWDGERKVNFSYKDLSKIENRWDGEGASATSQFLETNSPLKEKSIIINEGTASSYLYQNHKQDYLWKEKEQTPQTNYKEYSWTQEPSAHNKYKAVDYKSSGLSGLAGISGLLGENQTKENYKTEEYGSNISVAKTDLSKDGLKKVRDSGRWDSVQKDVQQLIDKAFKPRSSVLDTYLNSSKGDARSAVYKSNENWRDQLGKRTEYANPFSGNQI